LAMVHVWQATDPAIISIISVMPALQQLRGAKWPASHSPSSLGGKLFLQLQPGLAQHAVPVRVPAKESAHTVRFFGPFAQLFYALAVALVKHIVISAARLELHQYFSFRVHRASPVVGHCSSALVRLRSFFSLHLGNLFAAHGNYALGAISVFQAFGRLLNR